MAAILIADDVVLARDVLARALRDRGHRVLSAADGAEAVERFQRDRPDLVVLDLMMPRLAGVEACARIKAIPGPFTPVILVSARAEIDIRVNCLSVADDFLAKPYDVEELGARVDAHLRTRRLFEERLRTPVAAGTMLGGENRPASGSGFWDRASFLDRMGEEWRRAARNNEPLALLVAGAEASDRSGGPPAPGASLLVATAMQRTLRGIDILGRLDEHHVAGLLLNTHVTGAMAAADRLKRELKRASDGPPPATSMGISVYPGRDINEPVQLLRFAERALDRAREEGLGLICLYQHQTYLFQPTE